MYKKMTLTLDEAVYEALYRTVGKRRISKLILTGAQVGNLNK